MKNATLLFGFLLLTACGGGTDTDGGTSPTDAGTAGDAGGATDAGGDVDAGGGTDAGAADAGGADAGGGTDAGPSDAGPGPEVTLSDVAVYSNCMPIVAPDPIIAFWTVSVTGASGTTATLLSAKLTITGASVVTQELTVDTPSVALSGGSGSQMQRKTGADVTPPTACGELCGGATFSLELTYDVDGRSVTLTETGDFGCVY